MPLVSENRLLNHLLAATTVVVLICYAWLTAHLLEPGYRVSQALVSDTFVRTPDSKMFLFEELFRAYPQETTRIQSELSELDPLVSWLGNLKRPVDLVVDEKDPLRLLVTDTRIELGRDVLLARGQLSKAILKSWLLQFSSQDIRSSYLRTEVASDVLLAMLKGDFALEVPGFPQALVLDEGEKPWWTYADSYAGVCASPWKSLELASLCESKAVKGDHVAVTALSFRPFLAARIWKTYRSIPATERLAFVRRWADSLSSERSLMPEATLRDGWLAVVQSELERILPEKMDPLAVERATWLPKIDAPLVIIDADGRVAAPGTLKISSEELSFDHARMAVMTVCESPTLGEVLNLPMSVDRVVWRPECTERKTDFVQVRPSAIRIAVGRGLARRTEKLESFVRANRESGETARNETPDHMLGIATAKWDEQASAFQVHGALEVVEAFRLKRN